MQTLRILIACCVALGPSSVIAQRSGVLIGMIAPSTANPYAGGANIETARYQTLWIVHDVATPLRAVLPDIVVPRRTGFWRVGIESTCLYETDYRNERERDVIWRVPLGRVPTVETDAACTTADSSATTTPSPDTTQTRTTCGYSTTMLTFVSSAFIGQWTTTGQSEECEPRGFHWTDKPTIVRFDGGDELPIRAIVGPRARAAHIAAITGPGHTEDGFGCRVLSADELTQDWDLHWAVQRRRGRWVPTALYQPTDASCQYSGSIAATLPSELGGGQTLRPSWSVIRRAAPNAVDAFSSPSGDLVIVITADTLLAFESDGRSLGRRLLSRAIDPSPMGFKIVMIEWALGPNVARWDKVIAASTIQPGARVRSAP